MEAKTITSLEEKEKLSWHALFWYIQSGQYQDHIGSKKGSADCYTQYSSVVGSYKGDNNGYQSS